MDIRSHHWLVALSAAALAHLAVVVGMRSAPKRPPAIPTVIELGEARTHAGGSGSGPSETAVPAGVPLAPVAAAKPLSALPAAETVAATVVEPPRAEVATPKTAPKRAATPKPRQPPSKPSRSRNTASRAAAAQDSPRAHHTERAPSGRSAGGAGTSQGRADAGRGSGKGSGSGSARAASYYGKLAAWLNRHKRYPSRARRLRQEGTVKVSFTIDRRGRVLGHRIVASSGHDVLDQEVKAMLKRASPLPAFPPGMPQSQVTVTVPIRFDLR